MVVKTFFKGVIVKKLIISSFFVSLSLSVNAMPDLNFKTIKNAHANSESIEDEVTPKITHLGYNQKNQLFSAALHDNNIKLWNKDGTPKKTLYKSKHNMWDYRFTLVEPYKKNKFLFIEFKGKINILNKDGTIYHDKTRLRNNCHFYAGSTTKKYIITVAAIGDLSGNIAIFDKSTLKPKGFFSTQECFGPKDAYLFATENKIIYGIGKPKYGIGKQITIHNFDGTLHKQITPVHKGEVSAMHLTKDNRIVSAGETKDVKVWDMNLKNILTIKNLEDYATSINETSDKNLIFGLKNGKISIYSSRGNHLLTFSAHDATVTCLFVAPNNALYTGSANDCIKKWKIPSSTLKLTPKLYNAIIICAE